MSKILKTLIALLFLLINLQSFAQSTFEDEEKSAKIKAVFIYNFTKYITWPKTLATGDFKIGIYKNEYLFSELSNMAVVKKVAGRSFVISKINDLSQLKSFDIVYFEIANAFSLKQIYASIGTKPVLLVTNGIQEKESMINFIRVGKRQKFELNKGELQKQGLLVDQTLENISVPVSSNFSYSRNSTNKVSKIEIPVKKEGTITEEKENSKRKESAPTISNVKYDAIIAQMQAELESDKVVMKNQGQEISTLKSSIAELETTILLKENELDIVKQQIDIQSQKLAAISDSTILKAKELQENIEKAKAALGNLQSIKAELSENKAILESQKMINTVIIIVLIIIAILGGIAFKNYRTQKKQADIIREQKIIAETQRDEIHTQHEELEEKSREITDSINYAKRIQTAILPPKKLVKEYLKNSFVFYQPKDIVAGDFYWMEALEGKLLFAAADCTGHGVPGAMVSVICNNGLNRSVREYGLTDPGKILDKTREIVINEFEKSEEEVKDGMDIALCSLEGNILKYAGAHNPLWIVRKGETTIEQLKAHKQPIGQYDKSTPYPTHEILLNSGDSIYIFSDGFVDQFGGVKGKKYMGANFKRLLLSIQENSMEKQGELLKEAFENWRGDLEQLDDVCVIGVRV